MKITKNKVRRAQVLEIFESELTQEFNKRGMKGFHDYFCGLRDRFLEEHQEYRNSLKFLIDSFYFYYRWKYSSLARKRKDIH